MNHEMMMTPEELDARLLSLQEDGWGCMTQALRNHIEAMAAQQAALLTALDDAMGQVPDYFVEKYGLKEVRDNPSTAARALLDERDALREKLAALDRHWVEKFSAETRRAESAEAEAEAIREQAKALEGNLSRLGADYSILRERVKEVDTEAASLPVPLKETVSKWLATNKLRPEQVRHGRFPLGMVQRWIERAESSERALADIRARGEEVLKSWKLHPKTKTTWEAAGSVLGRVLRPDATDAPVSGDAKTGTLVAHIHAPSVGWIRTPDMDMSVSWNVDATSDGRPVLKSESLTPSTSELFATVREALKRAFHGYEGECAAAISELERRLVAMERVLAAFRELEWARSDWQGFCPLRNHRDIQCKGTDGRTAPVGTPKPRPHSDGCPYALLSTSVSAPPVFTLDEVESVVRETSDAPEATWKEAKRRLAALRK